MGTPEATAATLTLLVKQLGDADPAAAYRAVGTLTKLGKPTVVALKERTQLVPTLEPKQLAQWIRELDDDDFDRRERAEVALREVGEPSEPGLRAALRATDSAELRQRARRLLQEIVPLALIRSRAVVVLENIGSPEARQLLQNHARGDHRAALTRDAQASLARLARRPVTGK